MSINWLVIGFVLITSAITVQSTITHVATVRADQEIQKAAIENGYIQTVVDNRVIWVKFEK